MSVRRRLTQSSSHDVQGFVVAIVRPRDRHHRTRVVADDHDLAPGRIHLVIEHAAEGLGRETRAIDDHVGFLARVVCIGSVRNMLDRCSLKDRAGLRALSDQPGQVDGRVDADRSKRLGVVDSRAQLVVRNGFELVCLR